MRPSHRPIRALIFSILTLTASGCCTVAEWFCGPDKSEWVGIGFETPERTVATLREAIRRDDALVIYRCLGEDFKQALGVSGTAFAVGWEKIQEQVSGIHLMGNGTVSGPTPLESNRVRYTLERAGYRIEVDLVQQTSWEVAVTEGSELTEYGEYVRSMGDHASVAQTGDDRTRFRVVIDSEDFFSRVDLATVQRVGMFRDWKVDGLRDATEDEN